MVPRSNRRQTPLRQSRHRRVRIRVSLTLLTRRCGIQSQNHEDKTKWITDHGSRIYWTASLAPQPGICMFNKLLSWFLLSQPGSPSHEQSDLSVIHSTPVPGSLHEVKFSQPGVGVLHSHLPCTGSLVLNSQTWEFQAGTISKTVASHTSETLACWKCHVTFRR